MSAILINFNKQYLERDLQRKANETLSFIQNTCLKRLQTLKKLNFSEGEIPPISNDRIKELQTKILFAIKNPSKEKDLSSVDCKQICYYASDIINERIDYQMLSVLIKNKWNYRYLKHLLRLCLNHWERIDREIYPMYQLFLTRLKSYTGRGRYNNWKNNIRFLTQSKSPSGTPQNGAIILGKELRDSKIPLLNFQSKFDIPKDLFHAEYFRKVISTFYLNAPQLPDDLEMVLNEHGNSDTDLILISQFIHQNARKEMPQERAQLKSLALRKIGHPKNTGKWRLHEANPTLQKDIDSARTIAQHWIIQDYISEIFRILINDPNRRKFWLRYAEKISDVMVIGPSFGKRVLSQRESLRDSIAECFRETSSSQGAFAFVMKIGDYTFIEFSEIGNALYIYRDDPFIARKLRSSIRTVTELKRSHLPFLTSSWDNNSKRVAHQSGWQYKLEDWMNRYVI